MPEIHSHVAGGTLQWKSVTGWFDQHGSCVGSELVPTMEPVHDCQPAIESMEQD